MSDGNPIGHHAAHDGLLDRISARVQGRTKLGAVIVPTSRKDYLQRAFALHDELDCPVIALCSKRATAEEALAQADGKPRFHAVNVVAPQLPTFDTETMLAAQGMQWSADTSVKRNVALALATMNGWDRIMFLDDDMEVTGPNVVAAASHLGRRFAAVGLKNLGFPDNSIVCHALRTVDPRQSSFIGSGALAVRTGRGVSFFPRIYNEDWFFLLGPRKLRHAGIIGEVRQLSFDPYADPQRGADQELGDCLAEGVYALLDARLEVGDANEEYWRSFIVGRRQMINGVMGQISRLENQSQRPQMVSALEAALSRLDLINPTLCVQYLNLWRSDRKNWSDFQVGLPRLEWSDALKHLGLNPTA